ncbi:uncharacterized protein CDAR_3981 [Caerostris darwini]|uniref:Uncharacterized protein n=1 Tax=Caerostris darwini TaxID=1538125 RepID=A0AAV4V591_9ARAC|nr:uncharacterized protein CDAR_3981 [Caerostris darwini]
MEVEIIESKRSEVTPEHAVLIPILPNVKSPMPYVEAVAIVIGSMHIHSVLESDDFMKVYLTDTRYVDILVNQGISILGTQINVDYAVPRADKVILSNVDPIIPDETLLKVLGYYGTLETGIIHEKIALSSEYSHIECGRRRLYLTVFPNKKLPTNITISYHNMHFRIDVLVEPLSERNDECESIIPSGEERSETSAVESCEIESVMNIKPNIEELAPLQVQPTSKKIAYRNKGPNKVYSNNIAHRLKRQARKAWYGSKPLTRTQRSEMKNVMKRTAIKHLEVARGKKRGPKVLRKLSKLEPRKSLTSAGNSSSSDLESKDTSIPSAATSNITQYPLKQKKLKEFLVKAKFHRFPVRVAWEFLGNKTPEALEGLKAQLLEYSNAMKNIALEGRIKRLIALLSTTEE